MNRLIVGVLLICSVFSLYAQPSGRISLSDSIEIKDRLIRESNAYVAALDPGKHVSFPVGIKPAGIDYAIIIDRAEITGEGGFFDASAAIEFPGSNKKLCFQARRVPFSALGGIGGIVRLELVSEVQMSVMGGADLVIPNDRKTYVEFDCNGFVQMGISADIHLSNSLVYPAENRSKPLVAHFETVVKNLNDLMVSVTIEPFKIEGLDDYTFNVQEATWDQSDVANPYNFQFPISYVDPIYSYQPTLWRGIHFGRISITLPKYLQGKNEVNTDILGENVIFDEKGISGSFAISNLLSLDKGSVGGGFALSIERFALDIIENRVQRGLLAGVLRLPISTIDSISYAAIADARGQFSFTTATDKDIDVDIWQAKMSIHGSSSISITSQGDGIEVGALLNGELHFYPDIAKGSSQKFELVAPFEGMYISNKAPYFEVKAFGLSSDKIAQSLAGINFSISSINFTKEGNRAGVAVDLSLGIGSSGSNSFAADGRVSINAILADNGWSYDGINIGKFSLSTEFSGIKLAGELSLFNGSVQYGDGIGGRIKMELKPIDIKLEAAALFGKVNGYSYWYADAFSSLSLPITPAFKIVGLGGGAYSKMKQGLPEESYNDYGVGSSGICYTPSKDMGMGFLAQVGIATTDGKLVTGDAMLEMAFNRHGGISYINFLGRANIMKGSDFSKIGEKIKSQAKVLAEKVGNINNRIESGGGHKVSLDDQKTDYSKKAQEVASLIDRSVGNSDAPITAILYASFDFDNRSFFSQLTAYVNVAGVLRGVGNNGRAGDMIMYFGPDKWFVHCGTPTNPIGLELLGFARANSYFMMGHDMPSFPEPPKEVLDIIGLKAQNRSRDISSLTGGRGVAFGSSFKMDTGNIQFLVFYARLAAGLGFDLMLKDFGSSQCAGSDGRIGMNGWYGMGQAWAYVEGDIGIRVRMRFIRGQYSILKIGVGTLLEAQLPNPTWLHGAVGGRYRILGGLVKGNCKFEFELGEKCKIKSSAKDLLADIKVISDLRPAESSSNTSVFSKPQAIFNMPVQKIFEIDAPDGQKYRFRAVVDRFVALDGGKTLQGEIAYNDDSTVATIKLHSILPEKKSLTASVELSFEEFKNGAWIKVTDSGRPIVEAKAVTFTTGEAPSYIPDDNVAIEYPIRGQQNFYRNEYDRSFVVLDMWQDNLFSNPIFEPTACFFLNGTLVAKSKITTNSSLKRIEFSTPQAMLQGSVSYQLKLINISKDKDEAIDRNVEAKETAVGDKDSGEILITTKVATSDLVQTKDVDLYTLNFKTSRYGTLSEKLKAQSFNVYARKLSSSTYIPVIHYTGAESFEDIETKGVAQSSNKPLVHIETTLQNNSWFQKIDPLIYRGYPFLNVGKTNRNSTILGLPPYLAVFLEPSQPYIVYNVPVVVEQDYYDIAANLAPLFAKRISLTNEEKQRLEQIFVSPVPNFFTAEGEIIPISIKYVLPDGTVSSSYSTSFNYFMR